MAAWRSWPWRLLARVGPVGAEPRPPVPIDVVVVLERPWWARLLGTDAATACGVLGPVLVVGGGVSVVAGAGIDAAAVVAVGLLLCEVLRRTRLVGLRVDAEGWHVRNLFGQHDVPWSEVRVLRLAGRARARPAAAVLGCRHRRDVELSALAGIGRPRRLAWLDEVAPVALAQGVDVWDSTTYTRYWRGATAVPVPTGERGTWQVHGAVPPHPRGRWVVGMFAALSALAALGTVVAAVQGDAVGDRPLISVVAAGFAVLLGWDRVTARRQAIADGNPVRPARSRTERR